MSLFESSITGNILNDGSTTEISGITAGQLATVLTAYTPLTETATNSASISTNATGVANNAAAIAALQTQVDNLPAAPDLAPYALASEVAAAEGLIAANSSSITALNTSLTTGLASKANLSALDTLQLEVDGKSTPASVDAKLASYSTTAAMNSAITSANNATLASVASNYALRTVTDQLALDLAAKQSGLDVDTKIANALLDRPSTTDLTAAVNLKTTPADVDQRVTTALLTYVTQVALDAALALRDGRLDAAEASIATLQAAGFQTAAQVASAITTALLPYTDTTGLNSLLAVRDGRLDSAETSIAALQAASYQTSAQVASAIASALLPYVQQTGLDAALALRDGRLHGHDADILALQSAGPFATSSDLTAAETSLQSAIDAILAQLAALTTGGGSNLINAQAWSGEITWDLLLSVSLQNDNFTLSLACDSYSIAQADAAIATALVPYETATQRDAAISAALLAYSTTTEMDAAIATALLQYYTTTQVDTQIASAMTRIDLTPYYTSAQTDAAITAALVPVTLSNAPAWGANPPTWELLKGSNVLRNLHFAGPLSASLQNNTDTLEIDCDSYEKAETYTQAEVNSVVSGAIDALNVTQYRTESQVTQAIGDALVPYYTSAEVDSAIASNGVDLSDYYTKTQSDSRYFVANATGASSETFTLIRDTAAAPRQLRGILPRSPLSFSFLFSGTITELRCDAYSKAEADSRYLSSTGYTSTLDGRYLVTNANPGGTEVFTLIRDASAVPRQLRGILPRAPLGFSNILSGTVTELTCDAWTKAEADGRFYIRSLADSTFAPFSTETGLQNLSLQVTDHETRITALEASLLPADISVNSISATGDWLTLVGGSSGTRIHDDANNALFSMTTAEAFFGVRSRVDWRLTIDTPSGSDEGLYTAAVRARIGDSLLTLTGGTAGLRAEGAVEITGVTTGTEAVFATSVATPQLQPSPSTNAYMRIFTGSTGLEVSDQSLNPLLQVEDDETKSLSRLISVTRSATGGVVGAVLKNTAGTGFARLQLDANNSTGLVRLEAASAGGCTLDAPNQEIWLQNRTSGAAPLVIETDSDVTVNYGFNNLSDAKVKENIRDADLGELLAIFNAATPKRYDRVDVSHKGRLGFLAQDFELAGVTGKTRRGEQELLTLDYGRLTAVLWGVCKSLQNRIEALETKLRTKPKPKAKSRS